MIKARFALAASVLTVALAGCGASTSTTASVGSAASGTAVSATTPTAGNAPAGAPGMQTVTGTAADKASAAALAKYPGTVERVTKFGDGYVVDVTTSAGTSKHVKVSSAYAVTGLMTAPTGGAPGGTPPSGVQPKGSGTPGTTPSVAASS